MKQKRNCFWCAVAMINLLLVSCPISLFRRAKTMEEHVIAVLVLIGCIFLLAIVDAVGIVIVDGLAEVTNEGCAMRACKKAECSSTRTGNDGND